MEFTNKRYITNKTAISTVGYSNIRFNFYMAADSLESGEYCQAQYSTDGGTTWISVAEIRDPNDLNKFAAYNVTLPSATENIANLKIRFRIYGNATNTLSVSGLTVAGDYVFTFTCTDNSGASNSDTARVTAFPQPPPASEYPTFNSIPFAIGIAVDDLGEKFWTPDQSRDANNAGYQTILNVGQTVGTRIMTAWIMCDLDRSNILAKAAYDKPLAPYNMSTLGTSWDNTEQVSPNDFVLMNLVKDNNAHMEFGLHGVIHVHPDAKNVYVNAEYALINANILYQSTTTMPSPQGRY